ncbi:MAG: DUF1566 domain-containing protein [Bacteroidales bacterium]|nr:DUF1566 domain-containing protein [Bacteroidales bacterium]
MTTILRICLILAIIVWSASFVPAQVKIPFRLPVTGQTGSFTPTPGEDSDFTINPPSLTDQGDGTIIDNLTGLMWQKTDGGEMTFEQATSYCNGLVLGGYDDWRLPTGIELFSINNYDFSNPSLNGNYFTKNQAGYWWTSETRADDATQVWVVNAGGGIGAHPKNETLSAGGSKRFHARAVRNVSQGSTPERFIDQGDGTVADNLIGLVWQKVRPSNLMTWEAALQYAGSLDLGGKSDWRLPNVKEQQSLNDPTLTHPSFNNGFFSGIIESNFWSSTTLQNTPSKAWDINVDYGIVSYNDKTIVEQVLLVRGPDAATVEVDEVSIPGGEYQMGDHFGFFDPNHPSDEIPIHLVRVDSFNMARKETTNQQFLQFLSDYLSQGLIEVRNNIVYVAGDTEKVCYTTQYEPWYSIGFDGSVFFVSDFRGNHPMVGVMWSGAALYCNWLSQENGLEECYDPATWTCYFERNGFRLPTEAEWEYAGRGGNLDPYLNYPKGNTIIANEANIPQSGDPYETGPYPQTTPVGFYDGSLRTKADFNWPGSASSYQTTDGANGFGLYDMQGNVWEFLNDWYGQNYYSGSSYDNPKGPESGFIMPDGKPYRGMRGGNWYNGYTINGVNDGHSRVSNRNPSYYRGPQDPNHPWYHVGFRVARKYGSPLSSNEHITEPAPSSLVLLQNTPNPCKAFTALRYYLPRAEHVFIEVFDLFGKAVISEDEGTQDQGWHSRTLVTTDLANGVYLCRLRAGAWRQGIRVVVVKG